MADTRPNDVSGLLSARRADIIVRATADVGDLERWRQAARRAGRLLGVPVRTGVAPDGSRVWAVDNS